MLKFNTCILGGGWAGLLGAKRITEANIKDVVLIEARKLGELGGLLRTEQISGFSFDCGGLHLLFSRYEKILSEITNILKPNYSKRMGNNYEGLSKKFDYNSVVIVGIALKGKTPNQTTVYVPDPRIIFYRYTWMSSLIPPKEVDKSNLIAEITVPKDEEADLEKIVKKVIHGFLNIGVIKDESSILFTKVWFNKYGYPIYSLDHNEVRENAFRILEHYGIKSVGGWGSWHYRNTDMVSNAVNQMNLDCMIRIDASK